MKMSMPLIRVLCVDDHTVVREGLCTIINKNADMKVVAEAANALDALEEFRRSRPDVTLMDLQLPNVSGFDAIRAIREIDARARIIVLTMYKGDADMRRALDAGASAYLLKSALAEHLIRTLRDVASGTHSIPSDSARSCSVLTARETDIVRLIAEGWRDKEIAARLGIHEDTVGAHTRRIFAKLQVHDRSAALAAAIRRGIIHLD